jgi:hypothetical protein
MYEQLLKMVEGWRQEKEKEQHKKERKRTWGGNREKTRMMERERKQGKTGMTGKKNDQKRKIT